MTMADLERLTRADLERRFRDLVTRDRLILATLTLERIERMGGAAGAMARETLRGFTLADETTQ